MAQSTFGTILGTVTDSTGAVVPQAKIKIINQGENISKATLTDSQGNYEALNLKAGTLHGHCRGLGLQDLQRIAIGIECPADHARRCEARSRPGQRDR